MNEFIASIKSATASLHTQLEQSEISNVIMSQLVTEKAYAEYLSRIQCMHEDIETHTFPIIHTIIKDTAQRTKSTAIAADLDQLKYASAVNKTFLDAAHSPDLNFNLGLMYVTEGSVLGGQVILKNIKKQLGEDIASRFLNVYGQQTGHLWRSFLIQLAEYQSTLSQKEKMRIIDGAKYGFERAYSILM
jgi:heme oxygenase